MHFIVSRCMEHDTYVGNNNINKYNTGYIFVRLCAGRNSSLPVGFYIMTRLSSSCTLLTIIVACLHECVPMCTAFVNTCMCG